MNCVDDHLMIHMVEIIPFRYSNICETFAKKKKKKRNKAFLVHNFCRKLNPKNLKVIDLTRGL